VECRPMRMVEVALSRMSVDGSKERMVLVDVADSRVEDAKDLVMNEDDDG
jgi:hypothetical protein